MRCFGHKCRENVKSGNPILIAKYKYQRIQEYWKNNSSIFTVSGNITRARNLIFHCNLCGKYCKNYSDMEHHFTRECQSIFIQCDICKQYGERNNIDEECKFCNNRAKYKKRRVYLPSEERPPAPYPRAEAREVLEKIIEDFSPLTLSCIPELH